MSGGEVLEALVGSTCVRLDVDVLTVHALPRLERASTNYDWAHTFG
jgi:hypothetical protein